MRKYKWKHVSWNASERTDNWRELSISSRDKRNSCLTSPKAFFHLVFSSSSFRFANFPWVPALQTISNCLNDTNQWIHKRQMTETAAECICARANCRYPRCCYLCHGSQSSWRLSLGSVSTCVKRAAHTRPTWKPQTDYCANTLQTQNLYLLTHLPQALFMHKHTNN